MAVWKSALNLDELAWDERGRGIAVRSFALVAAAIVLLWVCRNGQSTAVVWTAFSAYVAAAAIWVRGQYAASLKARWVWTPDPWLSFCVLLVCLVVLAMALCADSGTFFIGGLVGAFFSLGYLSMGLRRPAATSEEDKGTKSKQGKTGLLVWAGLFLVLSALALIGLGLLGEETWLRLLVLAALLVPVPLAVLSDRVLFEVWRRDSGPWEHAPAIGAAVGAVLLLGGWVAAGFAVDRPWQDAALVVAVVVIVIVLVFFALVSSTYADIAVIIAVIAILGITHPPTPAERVELGPTNTKVLVALGDSYMSGEGAKTYFENTDRGGQSANRCRRAPTAWSVLAGQRHPFNGYYSVACSGAQTFNVNLTRPKNAIEPKSQFINSIPTQLRQYLDDRGDLKFTPKLVVVSLGGNDAGFSTIGAMCLGPQDCDVEGRNLWLPKLPDVGYQLRATFDQISDTFNGVPVAVVGYPDPIYTPGTADEPSDCGNLPLSRGDRTFVEELLTELNSTVREAARDAGFYYVSEMEDSLAQAHLQLCDPLNNGRPGINTIGLQSVTGEAEERFNPKNWYHNSLHPNERGHAALLAAFESWLAQHEEMPADIPGYPRDQAVATAEAAAAAGESSGPSLEGVTEVECQLYEVDPSQPTCEGVGYNWLGSQVTDAVYRDVWGLIGLLVGAGAWLLAVSFFAWRTRVNRTPGVEV